MRISVIINPKAGSLKLELVERKIREALFRCDLEFHMCGSLDELCKFTQNEIKNETSAFLICGGDGTVNATLQCMLRHKKDGLELPPICLVSSGTANDLAHEIDISDRIDQAARLILEGREHKIDVIEIESNNQKKYMLTNGGIGIPAKAAGKANELRKFLSRIANDETQSKWSRKIGGIAQKVVKQAGSTIYSMSLLKTIGEWENKDWQLDIELPGQKPISTKAPFLLVNNQPTIGKKFLTAPYTVHNDGLVNLLMIESDNKLSQLEKVMQVYMGTLKEGASVKSIETPEFKIKSKSSKNKITFFGDGEILFRDVDEVKVRCLKRNIGVMVRE